MVNLKPISVDPEAIHATRCWSLSQDTSFDSDQPLRESISRLGIIHPPMVRRNNTSYEVICGAKRIAAAKKISLTPITCLELDSSLDKATLLSLIAEDQKLSGPLSPIQTARLIAMVGTYGLEPKDGYMQRLTGISSSSKRRQLTRLLTLNEAIRNSIHAGRCSVQTALFLLEQTEADRSDLFSVISNLSLNANKQRRVIELSRIIAANQRCSIGEVFRSGYPDILENRIDNIPQGTALLLKDLFRISHPLSSQAEEQFNKRVKNVKLPGNMRITHSPSFERDIVTLEIDFPRFADFESRWEDIRNHWSERQSGTIQQSG